MFHLFQEMVPVKGARSELVVQEVTGDGGMAERKGQESIDLEQLVAQAALDTHQQSRFLLLH